MLASVFVRDLVDMCRFEREKNMLECVTSMSYTSLENPMNNPHGTHFSFLVEVKVDQGTIHTQFLPPISPETRRNVFVSTENLSLINR